MGVVDAPCNQGGMTTIYIIIGRACSYPGTNGWSFGNLDVWGDIEFYAFVGVSDFYEAPAEKVFGELVSTCFDMEPLDQLEGIKAYLPRVFCFI